MGDGEGRRERERKAQQQKKKSLDPLHGGSACGQTQVRQSPSCAANQHKPSPLTKGSYSSSATGEEFVGIFMTLVKKPQSDSCFSDVKSRLQHLSKGKQICKASGRRVKICHTDTSILVSRGCEFLFWGYT